MKNKRLQITIWFVIIGSMILGGFLGMYIIGKETGEYNYEIISSILIGTVLSFIIYLLSSKWNKKRNGNVPEVDERSVLMMQRYLMVVLYVVLFGSGAILLILYSIGIYSIETGMLIVYMMGLFILIGIGTLIVKRL
jgi:hypothetical protein